MGLQRGSLCQPYHQTTKTYIFFDLASAYVKLTIIMFSTNISIYFYGLNHFTRSRILGGALSPKSFIDFLFIIDKFFG